MTKREVIEYLGRSKRTIETYISEGRLPVVYINGPNGKQAEFDREAVEALKRDLDTPMVRAIPETAVQAIAPTLAPLAESLVSALRGFHPELVKPWLTLSEASEYSGLTKAWLMEQGFVHGITVRDMGSGSRGGRWRFFRDDLGRAE